MSDLGGKGHGVAVEYAAHRPGKEREEERGG
jgi:hypothetical protein